jgi:putative N6-adenine-specific DNA methylase
MIWNQNFRSIMNELFITCGFGLEPVLSDELHELGITSRKGFRGVYIPQTTENMFTVNYCSRIATRVLWPLASFNCNDRTDLYNAAKKIDWSLYLDLQTTFAIDANVTHHNLKNSLFAAFVVKDAICDQFRDRTGERPSVNIANPDIQLNLFIQNNKATISLDTSGAPLYKRGYRQDSVTAPLQESIAAAVLRLAGYTSQDTFFDPFCGSGTFLIEAAMQATLTPAGYFRKEWGFMRVPCFDAEEWKRIKLKVDQNIKPLKPGSIYGCDQEFHAISLCRKQLIKTGFPIEVNEQPMQQFKPPHPPTVVVTNPPYGKRLQTSEQTFRELGAFLRTAKARSAVLSPDFSLIRVMGRQVKQKTPLNNGGIEVMLYQMAP